MLHSLRRLQPPAWLLAFALTFVTGLILSGAAQAQVLQQKLCRDPDPARGRCDAGTCADIGGACMVDNDCADPDGVGPSGFNPVPVGGQLECEFKVEWANQIQDVLRIELDGTPAVPMAPSGVFNQVPPGSFPAHDLRDSIEQALLFPPPPSPPRDAISGNARCTDEAGETCDPETGAGCTLPCIICPALATTADPIVGAPPRGSGLTCPGADTPGTVFFLAEEIAECTADPNSPTLLSVRDQATVVWRNVCGGFGPPCDPITFNADPSPQTIFCEDVGRADNFKCYAAKPEHGTTFTPTPVTFEDQFGTTTALIHSPFQLCTPVTKVGREEEEEFGPEDPHLMCYKLTNQESASTYARHRDTDQFGSEQLRTTTTPRVLCLPALKNCDPTVDPFPECSLEQVEASLAHYACYNTVPDAGFQLPTPGIPLIVPNELELIDQFQTTDSTLEGVDLHCNPVRRKQLATGGQEVLAVPTFTPTFPVPGGVVLPAEQHLKCYGVDDTVRNFGVPTVSVRDQLQLDPRRITVGLAFELCEPATKELFALRPLRSCGLLGPEALLALVPLARLRRRRRTGSA